MNRRVDPEQQERLFELMLGVDDPKAKYRLGQRVVKVAEDSGGDIHPIGSKAQVIGSIYADVIGAAYLVVFDGEGGKRITFMVERKLRGENDG